MSRFSAGAKTSAGSTILPLASLFSGALTNTDIVEIGITNTTTTAFDVKLARISSGPGTVGAALVKTPVDNPSATSNALAFTSHTAGTVTLTDLGYRASIGAAIGAGYVFTFGGADGVTINSAAGTVNGICVVVENGTGQAAQVYFVWDE
jgi:hypothetical protein